MRHLQAFVVIGAFAFFVGSAGAQSINTLSPNWVTTTGTFYGGAYEVGGVDQYEDGHSVIVDATFTNANQFGVVWITYATKWYNASHSLIKQVSGKGLGSVGGGFSNGTSTTTVLYPLDAYHEFEPSTWSTAEVTYTINFAIQDGRGINLSYDSAAFTVSRDYNNNYIP